MPRLKGWQSKILVFIISMIQQEVFLVILKLFILLEIRLHLWSWKKCKEFPQMQNLKMNGGMENVEKLIMVSTGALKTQSLQVNI